MKSHRGNITLDRKGTSDERKEQQDGKLSKYRRKEKR